MARRPEEEDEAPVISLRPCAPSAAKGDSRRRVETRGDTRRQAGTRGDAQRQAETGGDTAVQMAVHGGWARCDPWSSRMLAGGMPPPPLSLTGVLASLLLPEPLGIGEEEGNGKGGLLVEVGAGLGQGALEWVGAGGSALAVELLESNAEQLRWSRDLNGWSRGALEVINSAAGSCPDAVCNPGGNPGANSWFL